MSYHYTSFSRIIQNESRYKFGHILLKTEDGSKSCPVAQYRASANFDSESPAVGIDMVPDGAWELTEQQFMDQQNFYFTRTDNKLTALNFYIYVMAYGISNSNPLDFQPVFAPNILFSNLINPADLNSQYERLIYFNIQNEKQITYTFPSLPYITSDIVAW